MVAARAKAAAARALADDSAAKAAAAHEVAKKAIAADEAMRAHFAAANQGQLAAMAALPGAVVPAQYAEPIRALAYKSMTVTLE